MRVMIIKLLGVGQSVLIGIRRMKVACSPFLFYQNIRGEELDEKLLKLLNKMNIF